jgi:hypothetical protein
MLDVQKGIDCEVLFCISTPSLFTFGRIHVHSFRRHETFYKKKKKKGEKENPVAT